MMIKKEQQYYPERISQLPVHFTDTIDIIMDIVAKLEDVAKVILFGSCARGSHTDKSDIDLLILLDNPTISFRELENKVGVTIFEQFDTNYRKPVDFLFADIRTFTNTTHTRHSIYNYVKNEGITLYE